MSINWLLLGSVIVYICIVVGVGAISSRRHPAKDTKDMALAGKQLGPLVLGGTMAATWVGGGTITGGSLAVGANYGVFPALGYTLFSCCAPLLLYVIASKVNRRGAMTVGAIFHDRYGDFAKYFSAIVIVIAYVGTASYQFKAFGNAIYVCTGINIDVAMVVGVIIITSIAMMGGMRSVAITDCIGAIFICFAMIVTLVTLTGSNGGFSGIAARAAEGTTKFPFGNMLVLDWLALTFGGTMNIIGDQNFIQRMSAGKNDKTLKRAIVIFVVLILAVQICSSTLGWVLRTKYPDVNSSLIFFTYAADAAPVIGAMMLACGAALILTTANSYLLSATTSGVMDLWCVFVDKKATEKRKVWYIRACLVVFAVVAFVMCRFFPDVLSIQTYVYALYSSAITPALFAALLWKKVTKQGAVSSIVSGTLITLVNEFSGKPIHGIASAIFAIPVSVLLLYFVSKATYKGPTDSDREFFKEQGESLS
ncbi:MAG: sodium:solute symporter family protein [Clostridia bacterium]|jgi:SSS family solute:Na+ symporter|nr:sodium:solute symporter family protein [Clostridia bacterium]MCI2000501.1 sodium:solute symporter family protein [Clostridia bacterium]MCI2014956.1 sodium:solute symporter family protein [Clostridia bacterium]